MKTFCDQNFMIVSTPLCIWPNFIHGNSYSISLSKVLELANMPHRPHI